MVVHPPNLNPLPTMYIYMPCSRIVICQNNDDVPDSTSAIVLSDLVSNFEEKEVLTLHDNLKKIDVNHTYKVPFYNIVANQIWTGIGGSNSLPVKKGILIMVYRRLCEIIPEGTEEIRCVGVSKPYLNLIRDFADNRDLTLTISDIKNNSTTTRSIAIDSIKWLIISIFDVFVSILLKPFFSTTGASILIKFPVFRSETFLPISDHINSDYDSFFTLLTVSYFLKVSPLVDDCINIIPIRCFSTVSGYFRDYRAVIAIMFDLIIGDRIETAVVDAVETETGVRLERTVGHLTRRAIWSNISAFFYYGAACDLFKTEEYDSVLLTTFGPSGTAIAIPALEYDVDVYVLPHGALGWPKMHQETLYTGMFTEGTIVDAEVDRSEKKFIPTGFPKHVKMHKKRNLVPNKDDVKTILIGTAYISDIREKFIRDVVPPIINKTSWRVIVKTHPMEEISYYNRILLDLGIDSDHNKRIQVVDSDLYSWIGRSHLTLTTRSNVGIESVLLGTPAACYNPWSPDLIDPPYAKHGPVPLLRDPSDVVSLLTEWDGDEQRAKQEQMLDNLYMVNENSLEDIAAQIQAEMTGETSQPGQPE